MDALDERPTIATIAMLNDDDEKGGDDEEFWCEALRHLRRFHRYQVEFCKSDEEFLELILNSGGNVDVAVCDFHLEFAGGREMLGTEVLDKVRKSPLSASFPFIMMTNVLTYGNERHCYEHGASAVIAKFEVRPGSREGSYRGEGFADALHAQLKLLGVGAGREGRYYHFNRGWMFDSATKQLTDPSNVVVPLTWRGTAVLEKLLVEPGRALTPEDLGVDSGRSENRVLLDAIDRCCSTIGERAKERPGAARALEGFIEEFCDGPEGQADRDEAVRWLACLMLAVPVFDAILPAEQTGNRRAGTVSAVELRSRPAGPALAAPDTAGKMGIIADLAQECRRGGTARETIESLGSDAAESAAEPLKEFYDGVRFMAERPDAGQGELLVNNLYGRFFCHLFPDLPASKVKETGFTLKNLRQRVIPDLRRALRDTDRSRPLISSVRDRGYCFESEVERNNSDRNRRWWTWLR